ncbi:MAG: ATP12 family chaperone protein [Kordiimonas sp.]
MKRFYKDVSVEALDGGYQVQLDGRVVKTPGKETLSMPTEALADAVAEEWRKQGEKIDTESMPLTRLANTVLDRVSPRFEAVANDIAAFGGTDLLCYRAVDQDELEAKQAATWNPYLEWAEDRLGAKLVVTSGIMPVAQDKGALDQLAAEVDAFDAYELTALHEFTNGFGSLVLALAYMKNFKDFEACWQASILDQTHQEELWGVDYEAEDKRALLLRDLKATCDFLSHLRNK